MKTKGAGMRQAHVRKPKERGFEMRIGVLKEVKPEEFRVALTPENVRDLTAAGHKVVIQQGAGVGAGFTDEDYRASGGDLAVSAHEVTQAAELILKVKEPIEEEFPLFRREQVLFSYLHSETRPKLVDMLLEKRLTAIAFENVRESDGSLPLLRPMSIIAGQQAVLQGMQFLWNHKGGVGTSLVAYPGLDRPRIVVLGAGEAGWHATRVAAALGALVHVFEIQGKRILFLWDTAPANVIFHRLCGDGPDRALEEAVICADMVVNTATVPPRSRRHLIDRSLVRRMKKGSVIVDVTANLEGAVETIDRYTTHKDPVWEVDGVLHYAVTNIPGTVARTASQALALDVFPYLRVLAEHGIPEAFRIEPALLEGLTTVNGILTWPEAGRFQERPWVSPREAASRLWGF